MIDNLEIEIKEPLIEEKKDKKFGILEILKHCFSDWRDGVNGAVLFAVVLWGLTLWIPYVNLGTTVALMLMPSVLAKGRRMSPIEIFFREHRSHFLSVVPLVLSVLCFLVVTGVIFPQAFINTRCFGRHGFHVLFTLVWVVAVIGIPTCWILTACSLAPALLLDRGIGTFKALSESVRLTRGHCVEMFAVYLLASLPGILFYIFFSWRSWGFWGWLFWQLCWILMVFAWIRVGGEFYRRFVLEEKTVEEGV